LRLYNVLKNFVKNIRLKQQKQNILLRMNRKATADKVSRTLVHVRPHEPSCISKLLAGRDEDKYVRMRDSYMNPSKTKRIE
jgi:hypothetical protein